MYTLDEAKIVQNVAPPATQRAAMLPGRDVLAGKFSGCCLTFRVACPRRIPRRRRSATARAELDALGQPTVTAGVSSWGGYVGGGMSAFFTDMLGDRILGVAVEAGGTLADIGGQLVYFNRGHRWNWGGTIEALPYRVGSLVMRQNPAAGRSC